MARKNPPKGSWTKAAPGSDGELRQHTCSRIAGSFGCRMLNVPYASLNSIIPSASTHSAGSTPHSSGGHDPSLKMTKRGPVETFD